MAQYNLGIIYANGFGVEQNYQKAFEWFEQSANQGDIEALYNLGIMYQNGQGVKQDDKKSKEIFEQVCNAGIQQACNNAKFAK